MTSKSSRIRTRSSVSALTRTCTVLFCAAIRLPRGTVAFLQFVDCKRDAFRPAISMKASSEAASLVALKTLRHYTDRAEAFWQGTKDHDVTQNREAFLRHLQDTPLMNGQRKASFDILDLGCGPGRDVKVFSDMGHRVTGLDGCLEFTNMAKALCPSASTLHQDLHALDIGTETFDGIFANAALFHIYREELPRVMSKLTAALRGGGVLFVSNPRSMDSADRESGRPGGGPAGPDERYGHYQTVESWAATCAAAGLIELERCNCVM